MKITWNGNEKAKGISKRHEGIRDVTWFLDFALSLEMFLRSDVGGVCQE